MGFREEDHRGKVPFLCHHIKRHDAPVDVDLEDLAEAASARCPCCQVGPPSHTVEFLERSHYTQPTLKRGGGSIESGLPKMPQLILRVYFFFLSDGTHQVLVILLGILLRRVGWERIFAFIYTASHTAPPPTSLPLVRPKCELL